ncbi:GNAT family protein [Fulvivirga kasyanovii]|uniref:N-acetyltransferase n=1 Tax=Fulvivirga kasyanovii TaxID=396812 RepID=A0ABW9RQF2_9BACT|nr:GNAT family N-acetyltransferase [Fulvivirga kasyanovii]MTI26393.1 N-acetyltransferase [Fulvivirga kasyanovii]
MARFQEIETDRLFLRRLETSDWEMVSYLRSDSEVNKFISRPGAGSKAEALEFISKITGGSNGQESYYWVLTEKGSDTMIGSICLWNLSEDGATAEVGYDLSPQFQNKGFMSESIRAILNFGFNELNLDAIEAYTHEKNESSVELLKRNRFILLKDRKDERNANNIIFRIEKSSRLPNPEL